MNPATNSMVEGCCSATRPCHHQRYDPATICELCRNAAARLAEQSDVAPPSTAVSGPPLPHTGSSELYASLEGDSLDAIMEVIGEGSNFRRYNEGKSAMRSWFLGRLRRIWGLPEPDVREKEF